MYSYSEIKNFLISKNYNVTEDEILDRYKVAWILELDNRLFENEILYDPNFYKLYVKTRNYDQAIELLSEKKYELEKCEHEATRNDNGKYDKKVNSDFEKKDIIIGEGSVGKVYQTCCDKNCNFVQKELEIIKFLKREVVETNIFQEIYLTKLMGDFGIGPKFYDYVYDEEKSVAKIITEKLDGTLFDMIKQHFDFIERNDIENFNFKLDRNNKLSILINYDKLQIYPNSYNEILLLIKIFNKLGWVHSDIHSKNIMYKIVNDKKIFKLIDPGFAKKENIPNNEVTIYDEYFKKEYQFDQKYIPDIVVKRIGNRIINIIKIKSPDDANYILDFFNKHNVIESNDFRKLPSGDILYSGRSWIIERGDEYIIYYDLNKNFMKLEHKKKLT